MILPYLGTNDVSQLLCYPQVTRNLGICSGAFVVVIGPKLAESLHVPTVQVPLNSSICSASTARTIARQPDNTSATISTMTNCYGAIFLDLSPTRLFRIQGQPTT